MDLIILLLSSSLQAVCIAWLYSHQEKKWRFMHKSESLLAGLVAFSLWRRGHCPINYHLYLTFLHWVQPKFRSRCLDFALQWLQPYSLYGRIRYWYAKGYWIAGALGQTPGRATALSLTFSSSLSPLWAHTCTHTLRCWGQGKSLTSYAPQSCFISPFRIVDHYSPSALAGPHSPTRDLSSLCDVSTLLFLWVLAKYEFLFLST